MGWLKDLYCRYLHARHLPRHWRLRRRTLDGRIARQVVIANEYRLPDRFEEGAVVLDVGAHIGSFALAALRRGAAVVHCVEPDAENFALLAHNLSPYADRVRLRHAAAWRSDVKAGRLSLRNPLAARNTGAHQVVTVEGEEGVEAVAFDELIDRAAPGGRVRLVKMDCEGAEWPILLTSRRLDRVDALCGEYHLGPLPAAFGVPGQTFNVELLERVLTDRGFAVRTEPLPPRPYPCGLFFAGRVVTPQAPAVAR
ncbi:MAG: FkbM family methyltransferase [Gemmataceae bacterium]